MRASILVLFLFFTGLARGATPAAAVPERAGTTAANVMIELTFTAARTYADPFNDVTLDAVFIDPQGRELRVPAFWAGAQRWKVRYASGVLGRHRFRTDCSSTDDPGLHGVSGDVEVKAYHGKNPLYTHGPLTVSTNRRFLQHADGKPFFWLGDTWWMGLVQRLRWPEDFKTLAADRKEKGFNVIQIVAGLYPDMPPFDPRGANEAGFPWEADYARIRPEYFDAADQRLRYLVEEGFTPCIVGVWGYFLPMMGVEKAKQHWRNLIARYGALPVVWCVAGEANLPWYLAKNFPSDDRSLVKGWTEVARYVRALDPYHRLLTIHPTGINRLSARNAIDDVSLLDFDLLQTPHGQRGAVAPTVRTVRESYADTPVLPVINGEPAYEMLNDSLPTEWSRRMFWLCLLNGAAGHTYGANGIWQVNRRGQPFGPSPHNSPGSTGYGVIAWDEAMNLGGSRQVAFGKKLFERYAWQDFRPHPEWAEFADRAPFAFDDAAWIWFPEGDPARDAPAAKRWFRRTFTLPEGRVLKRARLFISADSQFTARVNKRSAGSGSGAAVCHQFEDLSHLFKAGPNVLAVMAENAPNANANPAGLIARLEIQFADGGSLNFVTDSAWRSSTSEAAGWDTAEFDDATWSSAKVVAAYGAPPWGKINPPNSNDIFGPQSAGIPGVVRIIYVPERGAVKVNHLGRDASYTAALFDPVTGEQQSLPPIQAGAEGSHLFASPSAHDHDWVIILESRRIPATAQRQATLSNDQIAWAFDWSDGPLRSAALENKLSGHRFVFSGGQELALNFSAALDRVAQPFLRLADFPVRAMRLADSQHAIFELESPGLNLGLALHFQLEGATRRKWIELKNETEKELLLLDVELDDLTSEGRAIGGGPGMPVWVEDELFAAIEHPAGWNRAADNRVQLAHYPGQRLLPGATFRSKVALVGVAKAGAANEQFITHLEEKGRRKKRALSVYTPLGINNQWGAAPTLDDEQTLDVLNLMGKWRKQGVQFDYFTLDAGWVDFNSDLTRFRPVAYPHGPRSIIERVESLGMKFGLWFATSWGTQSSWDFPGSYPDGKTTGRPYREGYPLTAGGITFCFAADHYARLFKKAVLHHVSENHARFLKFDGGSYPCSNPAHGHLPGNYAIERAYDNLIDVARSARAAAPDVFVLWYWGHRSPFWALHGDAIFESGLHMEGSGTSPFPTLYYRDSVTLAQDQNAQHATTIPPRQKDSLGVWLADNRWGNFMGKDRWREAMVMDLGRGSLIFPNLWGNLYHLTDDDVGFLARIGALAKRNEALFLHRRNLPGDPFRNEVYGYAHCQGARGFLFLNNVHFAARRVALRLDSSIGLGARPGTRLDVVSRFPTEARLARPDGAPYNAGDALEFWLRPFETLMLEVSPETKSTAPLPVRSISDSQAASFGARLALEPADLDEHMKLRFADAARFQERGFKQKVDAYAGTLPSLEGEQPILAVVVRLRKGGAEWRHKPTVVQIVQALVRIGDQNIQMIPVPDSRQHGNTQAAGCSWVVFKVRLNRGWSGQALKLALHAFLPEGVEAQVETWVVKRWWEENTRPAGDGYYTDAPS